MELIVHIILTALLFMSEYDDSLNSLNCFLARPPLFADYDPFPFDAYQPLDMPIKEAPPQPTNYLELEPEVVERGLLQIHITPRQ